ncbi:MAG: N-acetyl-alpha-D-glucosaminyl L-malate synthase BshA [Flavobacteriales bacterium]|nr:N-acetyl-alpha-D-glucosaminyl L-malate synthase BshA [Flavobacteriales bacterium]
MRIGIVCYPTYGGSGVVATELGKSLSEKGHEVHFVSYEQPVRLDLFKENIFYHEVAVLDYPLFKYQPYELILTNKLIDVAKFEKLDVLHVHYAIPHASAAYMAKKILSESNISLPFITTLHGTDITLVGKDPSFEPVITFAINHSDIVTAVSESLKNDTLEAFEITRPIEVIPNFIDVDAYQLNPNKHLRNRYAPNGEKILIHISNFRKVKRTEDVIKVFKKVRDRLNVKLIMVGDGPERNRLEQLCRQMGTCSDIHFVGKVKSVKELLNISDLFILTSTKESFGLAMLEGMAAGVPAVSTNTGGIPEVNIHGESGLLCEVGDIEQMASNSIDILTDENALNQYKVRAKKRAEHFHIEVVLDKYVELYERVLK